MKKSTTRRSFFAGSLTAMAVAGGIKALALSQDSSSATRPDLSKIDNHLAQFADGSLALTVKNLRDGTVSSLLELQRAQVQALMLSHHLDNAGFHAVADDRVANYVRGNELAAIQGAARHLATHGIQLDDKTIFHIAETVNLSQGSLHEVLVQSLGWWQMGINATEAAIRNGASPFGKPIVLTDSKHPRKGDNAVKLVLTSFVGERDGVQICLWRMIQTRSV